MATSELLITNRLDKAKLDPTIIALPAASDQGVPGEAGPPGPSGPRVSPSLSAGHPVFIFTVNRKKPNAFSAFPPG